MSKTPLQIAKIGRLMEFQFSYKNQVNKNLQIWLLGSCRTHKISAETSLLPFVQVLAIYCQYFRLQVGKSKKKEKCYI